MGKTSVFFAMLIFGIASETYMCAQLTQTTSGELQKIQKQRHFGGGSNPEEKPRLSLTEPQAKSKLTRGRGGASSLTSSPRSNESSNTRSGSRSPSNRSTRATLTMTNSADNTSLRSLVLRPKQMIYLFGPDGIPNKVVILKKEEGEIILEELRNNLRMFNVQVWMIIESGTNNDVDRLDEHYPNQVKPMLDDLQITAVIVHPKDLETYDKFLMEYQDKRVAVYMGSDNVQGYLIMIKNAIPKMIACVLARPRDTITIENEPIRIKDILASNENYLFLARHILAFVYERIIPKPNSYEIFLSAEDQIMLENYCLGILLKATNIS